MKNVFYEVRPDIGSVTTNNQCEGLIIALSENYDTNDQFFSHFVSSKELKRGEDGMPITGLIHASHLSENTCLIYNKIEISEPYHIDPWSRFLMASIGSFGSTNSGLDVFTGADDNMHSWGGENMVKTKCILDEIELSLMQNEDIQPGWIKRLSNYDQGIQNNAMETLTFILDHDDESIEGTFFI